MKRTQKISRATAPPEPIEIPGLSLVPAEKGVHRSMWETLGQLRAILPYLSHLAPLLDRGSRISPELNELTRTIQSGTRDLETYSRNQTLQLERMEDQVINLQAAYQLTLEETRGFASEMRAFRRWMIRITLATALIVGATAGMIGYLLLRA